jgi:hypothetical protein
MKSLIALLIFSAAGFGQDAQSVKPQVQKVVRLTHANPEAIRNLLSIFNAQTRSVNELRAISISGSPETVAAMEEIIHKFDVPSKELTMPPKKSVELTFHILAASKSGANQPIPGMEAVVRNMQTTFGYTAFELIDVMQLRVLDESVGEASSQASFRNSPMPLKFQLRVAPLRVLEGASGPVLQLGNLRFETKWPSKTKEVTKEGHEREWVSYTDNAISTSLEIKEGQKVVVGKANLAGPDYTVFLVVSGKVVD